VTGLRFGLKTYDAAPWPELQERWRSQEALGFDALWAGDHLWSMRDEGGVARRPRFDAWLMAAGIAGVTSRVDVGTLVSPLGLRHPAGVGKLAATLDHLSGGRAIAGIGAGGNPKDRALAGAAGLSPAGLSGRLDEYARIVRAVMAGGDLDVDGEHYSSHGVAAPESSARLLVAGHGRRSIAAAAAHADIWNSYGVLFSQLARGESMTAAQSQEATRRRVRLLDEECERIGRDPGEVTRSMMLAFTDDRVWTSAGDFRETIGRYAEIGISEFMFPFPLQGPHDMDVFAEVVADIMPRLQAGERP
jgi:alkanesulfonate monooxygenase SsuD/methylene tetrahydromethanopterin reductase-like flavin-dependent oxidoreductase (luciferase family)